MQDIKYVGNELELFEHAQNWKNYFARKIKPYLGAEVLEVGAGIGGTTKMLLTDHVARWLCVEPDYNLFLELQRKIDDGILPPVCKAVHGTTGDLSANEKFDSICYIDVIEHIEQDYAELKTAAGLLKSGGHLIILVPAHQSLFSPFDKAIGHYRRYNKMMLRKVIPENFQMISLQYLDTFGFFSALVNKLVLKQPYPTPGQIKLWDGVLVPLSKVADTVTFNSIGKTLIGIWKKN